MVSHINRHDFSLVWVLCGTLLIIGAVVLYWFDPAHSGFYPVCALHQTTGLLCPGCGGLRALHQLLHGHFVAAFRLNALLVLSLPVLVGFVVWYCVQRFRNKPVTLKVRPAWIWVGFGMLIAFGIGRNLLKSETGIPKAEERARAEFVDRILPQ